MATNKKTPSNIDLDCSLSQDSLDYLKINKQPFAADVLTEASFFSFPALDKIIENLQHQVQFSDLLLIVEGPYGSGKTSLFRNLIHREIENTKSLPIQAEATDTLIQIQQKISENLQDLGNANYLDDNLKSLQSFSQTPLVVIDNAHVLSDTTLQELLRYKDELKHEHEINLKLILFANDGISNTLQKIAELDPNQMYVQNMPTYTEKLAAELIAHKCHIAGYSGETLLSESELQLIDKKSENTPLGIMHQASNIIEKNIARRLNPPSPLWMKSLPGLALLFIALIAASIYFGILDTEQFLSKTEQVSEPTPLNKEATLVTTENIKAFTPEPETAIGINNTSSNAKPIERLEPATSIAHDINNKADATLMDDALKMEPSAPQPGQIHTEKLTAEPAATETTTVTTALTNTPAPETLPKKANKPKEISVNTNKKETIKPLHPALKQLNTMGVHDTSWLLKQKNTEWTLQLLGAREPETLLTFSRQHGLSHKAAWYKTWLKGKPYYVLVYGNYSSRDQARESIAELPEKLQSIKPWAKSIQSVQQAIK